MADEAPSIDDEPVRVSFGDDLRRLIDDGRTLAEAELAWQKSRASFAGKQAGVIAALGALGAVLGVFALVALTVGLLLALTPLLTAWGAMAAVAGGLLFLGTICGALAALRARRMLRLIANRKPER